VNHIAASSHNNAMKNRWDFHNAGHSISNMRPNVHYETVMVMKQRSDDMIRGFASQQGIELARYPRMCQVPCPALTDKGELTMQPTIDNVTYDIITVLQSKMEGLTAYEQYIKDCQAANNTGCAQVLQSIQQQDQQQVQQLQQALKQLMTSNG
jgi:hypothetical protein